MIASMIANSLRQEAHDKPFETALWTRCLVFLAIPFLLSENEEEGEEEYESGRLRRLIRGASIFVAALSASIVGDIMADRLELIEAGLDPRSVGSTPTYIIFEYPTRLRGL